MIPIGIATQAKAIWAMGKVWILLGLVLAILAAGFYVGKRWEVGNTEEALRERDNAQHQAQQWKQASDTYKSGVVQWETRYAADKKAADDAAALAARLLDELQAKKAKADADAKAWQKRYQDALKSPDCAELVKETRCAAFLRY